MLDPSVAGTSGHPRAASRRPVFADADDADRVWLVAFTNDAGPVSFFRLRHGDRHRQLPVRAPAGAVDYELASMEPFSYQSRDGLTINGYLTFPPAPTGAPADRADRARRPVGPRLLGLRLRGAVAGQPRLPVHPGQLPRLHRVRQGVPQRGRPRVGQQDAGRRQRRRAHAISQGWADPERIAIVGGSYGGYAALAGAAFTPDLYCCAVDIVGPSNLITLIETIPPYWAPLVAQFHRRVGDPAKDKDFLWSRSPLSAGRPDPDPAADRAGRERPAGQAGRVRADRGGAGEGRDRSRLHAVPGRGPWLRQAGEPAAFFAAADKFLSRYLGGRAEALGAAAGRVDGRSRREPALP